MFKLIKHIIYKIYFQISWTLNHKKATTGEIKLRIFDEDGLASVRKAQRNNEDVSKVKELTTVSFYHKVIIIKN